MLPVLGVVFQKGGVGKTTTAINIAAAFARRDLRTLLIDFDQQASATSGLGGDTANIAVTVLEALQAVDRSEPVPREAVLASQDLRLEVLPANITLSQLDRIFSVGGERVLSTLIGALAEMKRWDLIIIDSPPGLGLATLNVLLACTHLIIPVQTRFFAQDQLEKLLATLRVVERRHGKRWDRTILVPTMVRPGTIASKTALEHLQKHYGDVLAHTQIRDNTTLSDAQTAGLAIQWYAPRCHGAEDYEVLADEILASFGIVREVPA
jgi:chromosome partitioning protein